MADISMFFLGILSRLFKKRTFTIQNGLAKGLKRYFGRGFKPRFSLTKEERFLQTLSFQGKTVFDIGGYIGIYTLFFARAVGKTGKVVAFEPNPVNFEELVSNVKLNQFENVTVLNLAAGETKNTLEMVVPAYASRGTLDAGMKKTFLENRGGTVITVAVDSVDHLIVQKNLPVPDFIKIDVEGFEFPVLRGLANTLEKHRPQLWVEIHGALTKELVGFLLSKNYSLLHIETETEISNTNFLPIVEGHVYCFFR